MAVVSTLPVGNALHAARLCPWRITLLPSSPFSHSNLLPPRQFTFPLTSFTTLNDSSSSQSESVSTSQSSVLRTKNGEKSWRARVLVQKFFYTYISLECLYVVRLRIMTLPFGLGIHDDANQTSGGRTPSFSILKS